MDKVNPFTRIIHPPQYISDFGCGISVMSRLLPTSHIRNPKSPLQPPFPTEINQLNKSNKNHSYPHNRITMRVMQFG
jgi:hypothetical protein